MAEISILFGFTLFLLLASELPASSVHLAWDFCVGWGRKTFVLISFHFGIVLVCMCARVRAGVDLFYMPSSMMKEREGR